MPQALFLWMKQANIPVLIKLKWQYRVQMVNSEPNKYFVKYNTNYYYKLQIKYKSKSTKSKHCLLTNGKSYEKKKYNDGTSRIWEFYMSILSTVIRIDSDSLRGC